MGKINREDMLELTRRMTVSRNCFSRIAGAYMDEEGYVDGTFNTSFLKLKPSDQTKNLKIAKTIPFSKTNEELKEYQITKAPGAQNMKRLLLGLRECELKNDALLDIIYEQFGEKYRSNEEYAVYFFYGNYDVPLKASDKETLWESEEVYSFMLCAVCPLEGDYEPGEPEFGFLYPAFKNRSTGIDWMNIYQKNPHEEMLSLLGVRE